MFLRIVGTGLMVLLMPFVATAQEAKTMGQLDKEVQDLKAQMKTTLENLSKLTESVTKNTEATIASNTSIDSLIEKQAEMLEQLENLTTMTPFVLFMYQDLNQLVANYFSLLFILIFMLDFFY